jgi:uncharacterized SAM-dependent methyltransferase
MIRIETLLTEQALADAFLAGLVARRLDEKFFYWFPLSVRAWLALCSDGAYRNYVRSRSLIAHSADTLSQFLAPEPVEVLSLGAGQGDKDMLLLEALRRRGTRVSYLPVDASQSLLEIACAAALAAGLPATGIKADFIRADHFEALRPDAETPRRLILLLGNTLGAFDPVAEARILAGLLRPSDLLLLDGEIYAGTTTVQGYDNPLNRRFAWAPLHSVGIREADGDIVFEDLADARVPGLHPLAKRFEATRDCTAFTGGETLAISAGERLAMNHSYKYGRETFLQILAEAGLVDRWHGLSDDERFLMVLAGPK